VTKYFQSLKRTLGERVAQKTIRIQNFTYNYNEFEVAQYEVYIKDFGRVLGYTAVITFINDLPEKQKRFELPATAYSFGTQWLTAKERGYAVAAANL